MLIPLSDRALRSSPEKRAQWDLLLDIYGDVQLEVPEWDGEVPTFSTERARQMFLRELRSRKRATCEPPPDIEAIVLQEFAEDEIRAWEVQVEHHTEIWNALCTLEKEEGVAPEFRRLLTKELHRTETNHRNACMGRDSWVPLFLPKEDPHAPARSFDVAWAWKQIVDPPEAPAPANPIEKPLGPPHLDTRDVVDPPHVDTEPEKAPPSGCFNIAEAWRQIVDAPDGASVPRRRFVPNIPPERVHPQNPADGPQNPAGGPQNPAGGPQNPAGGPQNPADRPTPPERVTPAIPPPCDLGEFL